MLWLAGTAILLVAAGAALGWISHRTAKRYALATPSDQFHQAPTRDGWLLGLHRYLPQSPAPAREPVLLCHGLLSCRFSLDLTAERSLARYLRDRGFDVWLMDLRAHGDSVRNGPGRGWDWSLDEYILEDLPAAVTYVLQATGAERLHWVGHSLGGMILYAHCLAGERRWFRSAVTVDAPGHLAPLRQPTWPGIVYARLVPVVPVYLFKPVFHLISLLVPERVIYQDLLLERETLKLVIYNALVDKGSSRALRQLSTMVARGRFQSLDGRVDYEEGPRRIDFPLLVLRSPGSRAPEICVKKAYDDAASPLKEYVRLGRREGLSMDHNHFSVVMGRTAPREVFPVIEGWLRKRSVPGEPRRAESRGAGNGTVR